MPPGRRRPSPPSSSSSASSYRERKRRRRRTSSSSSSSSSYSSWSSDSERESAFLRSRDRRGRRGEATVDVLDLSDSVHEEHLREIFSSFGTVEEARLRVGGRAELRFRDDREAELAVRLMDGGEIDGIKVRVLIRPSASRRSRRDR